MTYTYAILKVSKAAFEEISKKLHAAKHYENESNGIIDMHGIALQEDEELPLLPTSVVYSRDECIFKYCPYPDICSADSKCIQPNNAERKE